MSIQDKIDNYLNEDDEFDELIEEIDLEDDSRVMDRMIDFMTSLPLENLTEEQQKEFVGIIDELADEKTEEELQEAFAAKRVKIKRSEKRKRKREYRRNRARLKMKARKFRRTAKFKQYKRKKKRKAASGKTSTGKRIRKFI